MLALRCLTAGLLGVLSVQLVVVSIYWFHNSRLSMFIWILVSMVVAGLILSAKLREYCFRYSGWYFLWLWLGIILSAVLLAETVAPVLFFVYLGPLLLLSIFIYQPMMLFAWVRKKTSKVVALEAPKKTSACVYFHENIARQVKGESFVFSIVKIVLLIGFLFIAPLFSLAGLTRLPFFALSGVITLFTPPLELGDVKIPSLQQSLNYLIFKTSSVSRRQGVNYASEEQTKDERGNPRSAVNLSTTTFSKNVTRPLSYHAPLAISEQKHTPNQIQSIKKIEYAVARQPLTYKLAVIKKGVLVVKKKPSKLFYHAYEKARQRDKRGENNFYLSTTSLTGPGLIAWQLSPKTIRAMRFLRFVSSGRYAGKKGYTSIQIDVLTPKGRQSIKIDPRFTFGYQQVDLHDAFLRNSINIDEIDGGVLKIFVKSHQGDAYATIENVRLESEHKVLWQDESHLNIRDYYAVKAFCEDLNISFDFLIRVVQLLRFGIDQKAEDIKAVARYNWYLVFITEAFNYISNLHLNINEVQAILAKYDIAQLEYYVDRLKEGMKCDGWDEEGLMNFIVPERDCFQENREQLLFNAFYIQYIDFLAQATEGCESETGLSGQPIFEPVIGFYSNSDKIQLQSTSKVSGNSLNIFLASKEIDLSLKGFQHMITRHHIFPEENRSIQEALQKFAEASELSFQDKQAYQAYGDQKDIPEETDRLLEKYELMSVLKRKILQTYSAREIEAIILKYKWSLYGYRPGNRLYQELKSLLKTGKFQPPPDIQGIHLEVNAELEKHGFRKISFNDFMRIVKHDANVSEKYKPWIQYFTSKYAKPFEAFQLIVTRYPLYLQINQENAILPMHELNEIQNKLRTTLFWQEFREDILSQEINWLRETWAKEYELKYEELNRLLKVNAQEFDRVQTREKQALVILCFYLMGRGHRYGLETLEETFRILLNEEYFIENGVICEDNYLEVSTRMLANGYFEKFGLKTKKEIVLIMKNMAKVRNARFVTTRPRPGGGSPVVEEAEGMERYADGLVQRIASGGYSRRTLFHEKCIDIFQAVKGKQLPREPTIEEMFISFMSPQLTIAQFSKMLENYSQGLISANEMEIKKSRTLMVHEMKPEDVRALLLKTEPSFGPGASLQFWRDRQLCGNHTYNIGVSVREMLPEFVLNQWRQETGWSIERLEKLMRVLWHQYGPGHESGAMISMLRNLLDQWKKQKVYTEEEPTKILSSQQKQHNQWRKQDGAITLPQIGNYYFSEDCCVWDWIKGGGLNAEIIKNNQLLIHGGGQEDSRGEIERTMILPPGHHILTIQINKLVPTQHMYLKVYHDAYRQKIFQMARTERNRTLQRDFGAALPRGGASKVKHEKTSEEVLPWVQTVMASPGIYYINLPEKKMSEANGCIRLVLGLAESIGSSEKSGKREDLKKQSKANNKSQNKKELWAIIEGIQLRKKSVLPEKFGNILSYEKGINLIFREGVIDPKAEIYITPFQNHFVLPDALSEISCGATLDFYQGNQGQMKLAVRGTESKDQPNQFSNIQDKKKGVLRTSAEQPSDYPRNYGYIYRTVILRKIPKYIWVDVEERTPLVNGWIIIESEGKNNRRQKNKAVYIKLKPKLTPGSHVYQLDWKFIEKHFKLDKATGLYHLVFKIGIETTSPELSIQNSRVILRTLKLLFSEEDLEFVMQSGGRNGQPPFFGMNTQDPLRRIIRIKKGAEGKLQPYAPYRVKNVRKILPLKKTEYPDLEKIHSLHDESSINDMVHRYLVIGTSFELITLNTKKTLRMQADTIMFNHRHGKHPEHDVAIVGLDRGSINSMKPLMRYLLENDHWGLNYIICGNNGYADVLAATGWDLVGNYPGIHFWAGPLTIWHKPSKTIALDELNPDSRSMLGLTIHPDASRRRNMIKESFFSNLTGKEDLPGKIQNIVKAWKGFGPLWGVVVIILGVMMLFYIIIKYKSMQIRLRMKHRIPIVFIAMSFVFWVFLHFEARSWNYIWDLSMYQSECIYPYQLTRYIGDSPFYRGALGHYNPWVFKLVAIGQNIRDRLQGKQRSYIEQTGEKEYYFDDSNRLIDYLNYFLPKPYTIAEFNTMAKNMQYDSFQDFINTGSIRADQLAYFIASYGDLVLKMPAPKAEKISDKKAAMILREVVDLEYWRKQINHDLSRFYGANQWEYYLTHRDFKRVLARAGIFIRQGSFKGLKTYGELYHSIIKHLGCYAYPVHHLPKLGLPRIHQENYQMLSLEDQIILERYAKQAGFEGVRDFLKGIPHCEEINELLKKFRP